jgi:hypothetical protein
MKIQKLQTGAAVTSNYVAAHQPQAAAAATTKTNDDDGLISKDLLK